MYGPRYGGKGEGVMDWLPCLPTWLLLVILVQYTCTVHMYCMWPHRKENILIIETQYKSSAISCTHLYMESVWARSWIRMQHIRNRAAVMARCARGRITSQKWWHYFAYQKCYLNVCSAVCKMVWDTVMVPEADGKITRKNTMFIKIKLPCIHGTQPWLSS
jgi:hypothetical protein